MEINNIIFPIPKSSYKEKELKDLIKIPFYEELFRYYTPSPKTRANFEKINPLNPREDIPNDASILSNYDDQVDELPSQRIPPLEINYQTVQVKTTLSPTMTQRTSFSPRFFELQSKNLYRCLRQIPCLYLKAINPTRKTIIYFHANCEDLNSSFPLVDFLRHHMRMNVLSVEYPGYGIYQGIPTEDTVLLDAEYIYKFIAFHSNVQEENIVLMGRSIGTGVACHVAAKFKPSTLVLVSPFLSLREIVAERYPMLRSFIKERFDNQTKMKAVRCPTFILHGLQDRAINVAQSRKLYDLCSVPCLLRTPTEMTHIRFQFEADLATPLLNFMRQLKLL